MFLRCTGCLSALKHTLKKSPGWCLVLVSTNGLRDVPVTARTFQRHRVLSTVFLDKQRPLPGHSRHTSCGSGVSGWTQSERVSTVAVELLKSADRDRYEVLSSTNRRHQRSSDGLFTTDRRISMQTRSSSSSQSSSSNKAEVETLKEASAPSSSSPEKASGDEEPEGGKPNKTQQLKKVFKEYGAVGVSFHIGISLMSLGMFYLLISSGIDMAAILCKLGFSEAVVRSRMAAGTSTFVLAYAIHKLFVPVRMSITLVSVPLIVRYLRKTGLFKPPTPAP